MYNKWVAYGQSKTANILFSVELAQRLGSKGLKAFALHPGAIQTNIGRSADNDDFEALRECLWWMEPVHRDMLLIYTAQILLTGRWATEQASRVSNGRTSRRGHQPMPSPPSTRSYMVSIPAHAMIWTYTGVCQNTMGRTYRIARCLHLMVKT